MAFISSIGAGMYSDLSICREDYSGTFPATESDWKALFSVELPNGQATTVTAGEFTRIKNVREFPAIGTPPNVVNVPVFGSKTSHQVQGQSDSPSVELQLNFVGTEWQNAANYLGSMVGDGKQYAFRFSLLNAQPSSYASTVGGLGSVQNVQWFWIGKLEALVVNPQLTDANTATLTITVQSQFMGAYTV